MASPRKSAEIAEESALSHPRAAAALLGHESTEAMLIERLQRGNLPHAFLITGPQSIGKATLAYRFARYLLAQNLPTPPLAIEGRGVGASSLFDDDDEEGEGGPTIYDELGDWIQSQAEEKGSVDKVESIDIYVKAKELGIEGKHRSVLVLVQTIFDKNIVAQIPKRASMLKQVC